MTNRIYKSQLNLIPTLNDTHRRRDELNEQACVEIQNLLVRKNNLLWEAERLHLGEVSSFRIQAIQSEIEEVERRIRSLWLDILTDWIVRLRELDREESKPTDTTA